MHTGLGMLGAGLPGLGALGGADGAPNMDGMMQAMQNPAMQQLMQQLIGQPGFMEARASCLICMLHACNRRPPHAYFSASLHAEKSCKFTCRPV